MTPAPPGLLIGVRNAIALELVAFCVIALVARALGLPVRRVLCGSWLALTLLGLVVTVAGAARAPVEED